MTRNGSNDSERLLDSINSPADLRRLPVESLPQVCAELREFIIEACAVNPGHFASSMGAVELTVALHYVFDTPYDRLVWDVGHQAYGHKILTGRRERFATNRKLGGLSGFPTPSESEYDTFSAGHASNSISAALGMAVASRLNGDKRPRNVVAIIGDASVSGGLAFEGINNATVTPNNLLIVLNDNDMSIDRNVGSLNSYLAHITTTKGYNRMRDRLYRLLKKLRLVGERQRGAILRFNNSLKSLLVREQNIFEGLNIRYFGPFDGHDVIKIVRVLRDIRDMQGPRLLHLRTVKGKGYAPAEAEPWKWHAPGTFDPATGVRSADKAPANDKPAAPKFQDVFGHTLLELAREDSRIVGVTAAMASGTSMNIMQDEMPDRVFDVGISEGHAVTFAGGMAKDGLRPFVAIYSSFLQRAYDHMIHDVALMNLPVVFCIDRAGIVGEDGMTHHGALDIAYLRAIPGMTVAAPADEATLRDLMFTAAHSDNGPVAIRYPRGSGHNPDWHTPMRELPAGRGRHIAEGQDVAILSLGTVLHDAAQARERFVAGGKHTAALYDMIFAKPLDEEILAEVAAKGCPIVTVEDGCRDGGFGSAVAGWMTSHGHSPAIIRLGMPDNFVTQGTPAQLKELCGYDAAGILGALEKAVAAPNTSPA